MTKYNNLLLDNQLCFALYAATNSVIRYYRFYLKEIGITYPQYLVLLTLWETKGIKATEIGVALKLDLSTITPILQRLEALNFIARERSKVDERVVLIKLTKEGLALEESIADIQHKVACKTHLSEIEFKRLKATLNDLTDAMEINAEDQILLKQCK